MIKSRFFILMLLCSSVLMAQDKEKRTWELSTQLASGRSDFNYSGSDFTDIFDEFYKPKEGFNQLSFKLSTPIYKSFSAYGAFRFNRYKSNALPQANNLIAQANALGLLDVLSTIEPVTINPDSTVIDLNLSKNNIFGALSLGVQYDYTINKLRLAPYAGVQLARMTNAQFSLDLETEITAEIEFGPVTIPINIPLAQDNMIEMKSESDYSLGYEFGLFADYEVHSNWRLGLGYDYSRTKFNFDNKLGLNLDAVQQMLKDIPGDFVDPSISQALLLAEGQTVDMSHDLTVSQSRIYLNVAYTF